jgi:hypothetical protein
VSVEELKALHLHGDPKKIRRIMGRDWRCGSKVNWIQGKRVRERRTIKMKC